MDNHYINKEKLNNVNLDNEKESSIDISIELSNDYYEAYITIQSQDDSMISREDIINELNNNNITFGIKHDIIDEIVRNPKNVYRICIAKGQKHENGIDGKIEYYFDLDKKKKPTQLEDGRVDHKELNYIQQVKKGEILAKKILPVEGKDGKTVTDRTIKAKPGKHVDFKTGKNVITSEDGLFLLAAESGQIKIENERINVVKVLEIKDNVGVATGNIRFEGKVIVRGNVESGYVIESMDEVEVHGIVEGAEIISGSIKIHKGVHNNARLIAEGDICARFMENCFVQAKGDIICDAIIHCDINCMGKIIANQKKGLILGGNINVREEIIAKIIGSQIGSITRIQVGIDEKLLIDIKNTKSLIEDIKVNLSKVNQAIEILNKKSNFPQKQIYLNKYMSTREHYTSELRALENNLKSLYSTVEFLKCSRVSSKEIYPGTNIKINNSHYIVKNRLSNVTLLKENGEIVIAPNLTRS